jgi:hypothetical protein
MRKIAPLLPIPRPRPQAIGSLAKELSAKPTEDWLQQYDYLSSSSVASPTNYVCHCETVTDVTVVAIRFPILIVPTAD